LLQGYPNLEYIIIDGGSTDETLPIIKKYEPWISFWVSEPDRGQSHAINKGFARSRGSILAWINSDDYYYEGAFEAVAKFLQHRTGIIAVGFGDLVDRYGALIYERKIDAVDRNVLLTWRENWFLQPACFWPKSCLEAVGPLDEDLHITMDLDLWLRFAAQFEFHFLDRKLGCLRSYPECKSNSQWARTFAEFAVVHVKHQEATRAISEIMWIYDAAMAGRTPPNAAQAILRAVRSRLKLRTRLKEAFGRFAYSTTLVDGTKADLTSGSTETKAREPEGGS